MDTKNSIQGKMVEVYIEESLNLSQNCQNHHLTIFLLQVLNEDLSLRFSSDS